MRRDQVNDDLTHVDAQFAYACDRWDRLPETSLPEVVVAGRSNCGKSSLINALVRKKALARTSSTPGRTQQLVFFEVKFHQHDPFFLVDLPGYGYAKVSHRLRESWGAFIDRYLTQRKQICLMMLLIDVRRDLQAEERDLVEWCAERDLPCHVVLTKSDKVPKSQRRSIADRFRTGIGCPTTIVSVKDQESIRGLRTALLRSVCPTA